MTKLQSTLHIVRDVATTLFVSAALWAALTASASAEVITRFDAHIHLQDDGVMEVTETIAYDFGAESRHGIYRDLLGAHPQEASHWYKERYVEIEPLSVTRNGLPEPYDVSERGDDVHIRIGDAGTYVNGEQIYSITYKVRGALASYKEGLELYWNVTGFDWQVPMELVTVSIEAQGQVLLLVDQACYAGPPGEPSPCDSKQTNGRMAYFTEKNLPAGHNLTVAQKITVPTIPPPLERYNSLLLGFGLVVVWFGGLITWLYRWRTKYRIEQAIVPQYEPFEDFKPMFTGVLFDNRLDSRDITAGIIYLAQQGFIKITQTTEKVLWLFETTDYEITLLRPESETETEFQKQILSLLFRYAGAVGTKVKLSEVSRDTSKQRVNYQTIQKMIKAVVKDLVDLGFLEQRINRVYLTGIPIFIFLVIYIQFEYGIHLELLHSGIVAFFVVAFLSLFALLLVGGERRTQKGYAALDHLSGFKDFLSTTESERYKFHNAPSKSPEQFMEYLPYAIAFGVEKEWAEVFKDVQINDPSWYSSNVSGSHFSAGAFATDMGSFASAFSGSTRSGGSSGSGSSGGGFSGGGGGGGGGGSW
ncbi:MAG: DUF2207 domain-containing protein [Candidatus Kaiserbacteria bacterium]|nr:DUF2207 domain-containing protein [Candidatus Kaiserbacteria bacterium]MCB9815890.1 DUF2207 domain-containing protein [Candidatus Nomurabacteria bacterium]